MVINAQYTLVKMAVVNIVAVKIQGVLSAIKKSARLVLTLIPMLLTVNIKV
jgi:hypothetical protein